jgi:SAM-dependent methyltransferase
MTTDTHSSDPRYTDYDAWGWLYNETMGPQYCQSQLQPLEILLLPRLPLGATLLDVCCGTGHLVQKLSQQGFQVTGIDGSEAMLECARRNAPTADFMLADVRWFHLSTQFDAAFSTSASLNHLLQPEDLQQVCQNVFTVLKPGGTFLFDLNHHAQMVKWWNSKVAEGEICRQYAWSITPTYDLIARTGSFQVTLFQAPANPTVPLSLKVIGQHLRQTLYRLLSVDLRRFKRWRFQLLAKFHQWEPTWQRSQQQYAVRGYAVAEVQELLASIGFDAIEVRTLDGGTQLDANHSAYFLCHKPAPQGQFL